MFASRPITSLGNQGGGQAVFWKWPKFFKLFPMVLNYVQHIFTGGWKFSRRASPPLVTGLFASPRTTTLLAFHLLVLLQKIWNTYPVNHPFLARHTTQGGKTGLANFRIANPVQEKQWTLLRRVLIQQRDKWPKCLSEKTPSLHTHFLEKWKVTKINLERLLYIFENFIFLRCVSFGYMQLR